MKKLIPRLGSIILLVFSILFGTLTTFTPAFANEGLSDDALDTLLGTLPSDKPESDYDIPERNDDYDHYLDDLLNTEGNKDDAYLDDLLNTDGNKDDDYLDDLLNTDGNKDDEYLDDLLNTDGNKDNEDDPSSAVNTCQDESKGAAWVLCTAFELVTNASDTVYGLIEGLLVVEPLSTETDSAVYKVWDYMRGFTNIIFVIFLIVVIYSQITGLGINNYGIKRILPRLIIAVILVNLSYIVCALLVDASNIVGSGISGAFEKIITDTGLNNVAENALFAVDWSMIYLALTGSATAVALFTVSAGGLGAAFWVALFLIIGVLLSILSGLITIGLRQVVVILLVAISPLAFVAYLLPNTEKWFNKWKSLLAQMIFFYPIFAALFYISKLAGLTIIGGSIGADGKADIFKVIVGLAVQVLPLFLSVSLLKMSGTILGKVSSGLDRAFGRAAKPLQAWTMSHAEQNKQRYLRQRFTPGSHLRNFLIKRQTLREMNTLDNAETVKNRAIEAATNKRASYLGVGEDGKPIWGTKLGPVTWRNHANSYTRAAARAKSYKLSATAAEARLANSLSDHGSLFNGGGARRLSARSTDAFEEMAIQEFWKENIAQADQEHLINRYLSSTDRRLPNSTYYYNRLVASAAGSFGYKGEKTIIAQVVKRSADIEAKRRAEAAIVINKFGYSKEFRNMMFDRRYLNDNGVALDAAGNEVEDATNFRPLEGKVVEKWHKYIYVDEHNKEIDRAKGDKMSPDELKNRGIRKVRYSDITDDDGNVISHVYEDDAGYVKEMIMNDMLIGDPITRRYAAEIGLMRPKSVIENDPVAAQFAAENAEKAKGMIRRYRTSIVGALQASGYSEHNAAYTAMLLAQLNAGNVNSIEQLNLAEMMSFNASGKVGKFLLNDGIYYKNSERLLSCFNNEGNFEKYLGDIAVALYGNQNSESLNGLRLGIDENGNQKWVEINHTSPDITLDDKKNYIAHKVFPKYIEKILGALGRRPSPNVLDNMKPENVGPLLDLLHFAAELAEQNADSSIPFEKRLDGNRDLFKNTDPNQFKDIVDHYRERVEAIKLGLDPDKVKTRQQQALDRLAGLAHITNPTEIDQILGNTILDPYLNPKEIIDQLQNYCGMNPLLSSHVSEIKDMAEHYLYGKKTGSDEASTARDFASSNDDRREFLDEIRSRFL